MRRACVIAFGLCACDYARGTWAVDAQAMSPADATIDALPFDAARDCPATYTLSLRTSASRYRILDEALTFWPHDATCNSDLPGATHLAVLGTMDELLELTQQLGTFIQGRFYVGGVQSSTATATNADWINFDDTPLLQTAWYTPESEPDDGGDFIENQQSQLLIIDRALPYYHDAAGISAYGAVCECDGVPVGPTAMAYVTADPNNPN